MASRYAASAPSRSFRSCSAFPRPRCAAGLAGAAATAAWNQRTRSFAPSSRLTG